MRRLLVGGPHDGLFTRLTGGSVRFLAVDTFGPVTLNPKMEINCDGVPQTIRNDTYSEHVYLLNEVDDKYYYEEPKQ